MEGEEMNVLQCGFGFSQSIDVTGKPTSIPRGGDIKLVLESQGNTDLFDWMVLPTQTKSGIITFYRRDSMSKFKTLEFVDAFCVEYYESFDHVGSNPLQISLSISAREMRLNDSSFQNIWPENI